MQFLLTFLALFLSIHLVLAENCTVLQVFNALQPIAHDRSFVTCQTDTNYSMLSFTSPSFNQSMAFCHSSACQKLLNSTLSAGLLPDCEVVIGSHAINLTVAVSAAARCSQHEMAVDDDGHHNSLGHKVDNIVTIVGHSIPMDALNAVVAFLFR